MSRYEARRAFPKDIDNADSVENDLVHDFDIWKFDTKPDLDHAERYLNLWLPNDDKDVLKALKDGEKTVFRADDLLRACGLQAAPMHDPLITSHFAHILGGKRFNPAILVNAGKRAGLVDGYHRVSVAWWLDPQCPVPVLRAIV